MKTNGDFGVGFLARRGLLGLAMASTTACGGPGETSAEDVARGSQALYGFKDPPVKLIHAPLPFPEGVKVCWESTADPFTTEKAWIRNAIEANWQKNTMLRFWGWATCTSPTEKAFHIKVVTTDGSFGGPPGDGMTANLQVTTSFSAGFCADPANRETCVRAITLHEVGHALGMQHEYFRPDLAPGCTAHTPGPQNPSLVSIGQHDTSSIMYGAAACNTVANGGYRTDLSATDIRGGRIFYGAPNERLALAYLTFNPLRGAWNYEFWHDIDGTNTFDAAIDLRTQVVCSPQSMDRIPITGAWGPADGRTYVDKFGCFGSGSWLLDLDGDFAGEPGTDDRRCTFGAVTGTPVPARYAGGPSLIATYNQGQWQVDLDNSCSQTGGDATFTFLSFLSGDVPVVADWNGLGKECPGIFNNGSWWVDGNCNFAFGGGDTSFTFNPSPGGQPVPADYLGIGRAQVAIYNNGTLFIDANGNRAWDGSGIDLQISTGITLPSIPPNPPGPRVFAHAGRWHRHRALTAANIP